MIHDEAHPPLEPLLVPKGWDPAEMSILAIDPGSEMSAWALYDPTEPTPLVLFGKEPNKDLLHNNEWAPRIPYYDHVDDPWFPSPIVVIEQVASMGMAVGEEVFETVFWSGRLWQALTSEGWTVDRMKRMPVKMHLCGDSRAKDSNIRQALIDRFGPGKERAIGTIKKQGPLFGVSGDVWAALALAVTYHETVLAKRASNG